MHGTKGVSCSPLKSPDSTHKCIVADGGHSPRYTAFGPMPVSEAFYGLQERPSREFKSIRGKMPLLAAEVNPNGLSLKVTLDV